MKRFIIVLSSILFPTLLLAQDYYKFIVFFQDKDLVTYTLDNPQAYLSDRAIDRRAKSSIAVDESDIPVNPSYIEQVLASSPSFEYLNRSKWLNSVMIGTEDSSATANLSAHPAVKEIRCVYRGSKPAKKTADTGKKYGKYTALTTEGTLDYGIGKTQAEMIGIDYLHRKNFLGGGMIIAVLDAGFANVNQIDEFAHIFDEGRLLATWDFVMNEASVYEDAAHGCSVLGAIAGYKAGVFSGTAPGASFLLFRSEDAGSETLAEEYNWVAAAEYADSAGADVINSSLGYTTFDEGMGNHTYGDLDGNTTVITRAADKAASKGILVVSSAGNSGGNGWHYIGAPADGDSVLAIGAVDAQRKKAGFSSFGPSADGDIKPNVSAMGQAAAVISSNGGVSTGSGTSFSAPVLAGAATVLWQAHPEKSNMEIFRAIEESADRYTNPNDSLGYGIPNFGVADMILNNTNLEEYFSNQEIKIFPNPVGEDSQFYVEYLSTHTGKLTLEIVNSRGKQFFFQEFDVYGTSINQFSVNILKKMAAGTYICTITDGAYRFTTKFVKY